MKLRTIHAEYIYPMAVFCDIYYDVVKNIDFFIVIGESHRPFLPKSYIHKMQKLRHRLRKDLTPQFPDNLFPFEKIIFKITIYI